MSETASNWATAEAGRELDAAVTTTTGTTEKASPEWLLSDSDGVLAWERSMSYYFVIGRESGRRGLPARPPEGPLRASSYMQGYRDAEREVRP